MSQSKTPPRKRILPTTGRERLKTPLRGYMPRVEIIDEAETPIAKPNLSRVLVYAAGILLISLAMVLLTSIVGSLILRLFYSLTSGGGSSSPM
ncbi:hypothetical protein H1S01_15400 [Heliobacterium chlorum]|uniref:Uncharacterized protein n=1 Tax=Heliobacterium chlorum TaxID=2698 RepID=A0ABR7T8E0_HELCL|nr:hypothetical protein [Heliobacterium chlorum]MBC9785871.1 hypothetical protein [Heliobacterium chlorum]